MDKQERMEKVVLFEQSYKTSAYTYLKIIHWSSYSARCKQKLLKGMIQVEDEKGNLTLLSPMKEKGPHEGYAQCERYLL